MFEFSAREGALSATLRVKAWHDFGLRDDGRPWGNVANRYTPGAPLSDAGAPRLSRFSGVALLDAHVQGSTRWGGVPVPVRIGQQSLDWGGRSITPGGLDALNPRDLPGLRRAGAVPAEALVPRPMLFARIEPAPGLGIEAYYQARFRPTTLDMCGTLWSYGMWQLQAGVRRAWTLAGLPLAAVFEAVGKHAAGLPDQSVLRYGRADIFGVGPIDGACAVNTGNAARQCSLRGYASAAAWDYRARLDLRLPAMAPQLAGSANLLFVHDVKGWSGDFLLNEGRKTLSLGLRLEYHKRYLAELAYAPGWGGDYNPAADRDTAAFAVGIKF